MGQTLYLHYSLHCTNIIIDRSFVYSRLCGISFPTVCQKAPDTALSHTTIREVTCCKRLVQSTSGKGSLGLLAAVCEPHTVHRCETSPSFWDSSKPFLLSALCSKGQWIWHSIERIKFSILGHAVVSKFMKAGPRMNRTDTTYTSNTGEIYSVWLHLTCLPNSFPFTHRNPSSLTGLLMWEDRSRSVGSGSTALKMSPPSSSWPPSASMTRSWRRERPL